MGVSSEGGIYSNCVPAGVREIGSDVGASARDIHSLGEMPGGLRCIGEFHTQASCHTQPAHAHARTRSVGGWGRGLGWVGGRSQSCAATTTSAHAPSGRRTQSVCEGKTTRRRDGQARCHSVQSESSSRESARPTPSTPVGERSRNASRSNACSTLDRPARMRCGGVGVGKHGTAQTGSRREGGGERGGRGGTHDAGEGVVQRVPEREAHAQALDGGEVRRHVAQEQRARGHRGEVERAQRTPRSPPCAGGSRASRPRRRRRARARARGGRGAAPPRRRRSRGTGSRTAARARGRPGGAPARSRRSARRAGGSAPRNAPSVAGVRLRALRCVRAECACAQLREAAPHDGALDGVQRGVVSCGDDEVCGAEEEVERFEEGEVPEDARELVACAGEVRRGRRGRGGGLPSNVQAARGVEQMRAAAHGLAPVQGAVWQRRRL